MREHLNLLMNVFTLSILPLAGVLLSAASDWAPPQATTISIAVDEARSMGPMDLTRYSLGQGGLSAAPMFRPQLSFVRQLRPKAIRFFIQEYYGIYPAHHVYDWTALDKTLSDIVATGARPMAAIAFKPKILFPKTDQYTVWPNDWAEWDALVYQLVRHCQTNGYRIKYWEIGNEVDIGEPGGCPYAFTPSNYIPYFTHTARAILKAAPAAKVGGPALADWENPILSALIDHAGKGGVQLDFVSWHRYGNDPAASRTAIQQITTSLHKYPALRNTETVISEWNMDLERPNLDANFQPAFILESVKTFQEAGLSKAFYYHIRDHHVNVNEFYAFMSKSGAEAMANWWNRHGQYDGLFDFEGKMRPAFRVFRWLREFKGNQIAVYGTNPDIKALAVKRGASLRVLLWNFNSLGKSYDAIIRLPSSLGGTFRLSRLNAQRNRVDALSKGNVAELVSSPIDILLSPYSIYHLKVDGSTAAPAGSSLLIDGTPTRTDVDGTDGLGAESR